MNINNKIVNNSNKKKAKQLKDIKLLRFASGDVKDILITCDTIISDIKGHDDSDNENNNNENNNEIKNDNNDNNDISNINNNDNKNVVKIPFAYSIQYNNIQNMEHVIWSAANTLIKKNMITNTDNINNNNNEVEAELPDFTHDVEINQIKKINELIQWRTELMQNCSSTDCNKNTDNK